MKKFKPHYIWSWKFNQPILVSYDGLAALGRRLLDVNYDF